MKAQPSTVTRTTLASPPVELLSMHEVNGEKAQTDGGDTEEENLKVPVELMMEFLGALMNNSFELASKLCQMILIYEPDNLKASEFHLLIQELLQQEREAEDSSEEDQEEEGDDDNDNDDDYFEDTDSK